MGWSSDGDPRLLAAMQYLCSKMMNRNELQLIQDETHIATKLRNRLLNELIEMTMGMYKVSLGHLKELVKKVHKSVHGLTMSDINPIDRQNFRSFEKIVEDRVLESLQKYVKGSEATIQYLKLCKEITSSFLDHSLEPNDRIFRMHHALYFLRIWKKNIILSRGKTLAKNFITTNAYTCIEINAKCMINLIQKFRDENTPELFLPTIFDSQTCEKTFRLLRSMGTINFTRINFSIYDLLHMIGRVEVQNSIAYVKLADKNVSFPPSHKRAEKTQIYALPTDEEIDSTLQRAKQSAIEDAHRFGLTTENIDIDSYKFVSGVETSEDEIEDITEDDFTNNDIELNDPDNDFTIYEDDEQTDVESLDEKSPFTIVTDEDGKESIVKKSCLVWMLTEPSVGLSKDRLRRVQVTKKRKHDQVQ